MELEPIHKETIFLVVGILRQKFIIPTQIIHQKIQLKSIAKVPFAKNWVLGLSNYNGKLLTVIDINLFLGDRSHWSDTSNKQLLIMEYQDFYYGLLFKQLFDNLVVQPQDLESDTSVRLPSNLAQVTNMQIEKNGETLYLLDIQRLFTLIEKQRIIDEN